MRFLVIILLFCFAVAGSAFLAKVGMRGSVEEALAKQSIEVLAEEGYDGVKVEFDHLQASVSGTVDRPEEVAKVMQLLVERVPTAYWPKAEDCGIKIRPTLAPRLRVARAEGSEEVRVEGTLSQLEDSGRAMIGSRLHALPGIGKVDNGVGLDPMVLPFPKMAEFASLASGLLAHPGTAEVRLEEGKLDLAGTVPNDGIKKGLLDLAAQIVPGSVGDQIEVKVPDTFTRVSDLKVTRNRFGVTLSGVFPSEEDRAALLDLLKAADPALDLTDRIEIAATCGPAVWQESLGEVVPAILKGLNGEMTAEFAASQVRVNGTASDAAARQILLDRLALLQTGKPEIELVADIAEGGGAGTASAVVLTATYEGGLLALEGRLPDKSLVAAIEAKVKEALPDVSVKDGVEAVAAFPGDEWTEGLAEFFAETLGRISVGKFVFKDGALDIEGRTLALPDRQIVQNLAVNTVPATFKVHNRLLHADQPFPKPALQPEQRTKLAEALKAFPVYFDKASEILKEEEKPKVASIVAALKETGAEVELVVTGFSDSVGNAQMNKELSLRRAGSVQAELVRLGVPAASLSLDSVEEDVSGVPRSQQWKSRRVEVSPKPVTRDP